MQTKSRLSVVCLFPQNPVPPMPFSFVVEDNHHFYPFYISRISFREFADSQGLE
jgi:hypothetical protein